jgi:omega-hydroxy-beta-dihydromenaquinone-9 sulfotransferase
MTPAARNDAVPSLRWTNLRYQLTFLSFIRPGTIIKLLAETTDVAPRNLPRAFLIGACLLLGQPLRLLELLLYGRQIARTRLAGPPIFIVGHWRSGTTHLHNLLTCDPAFGYISMYQALAPDCSLVGRRWLKPLLGALVPEKRPMDAMTWPMDSPQEEEVALAKICPYSFYVALLLPRRAVDIFRRHVLLEDARPAVVAELKRKYDYILRVATLLSGGSRLVLKNPVSTARIRLLLELYPDAKFVHIHRSPYDVYSSTRNLYHSLIAFISLQGHVAGNYTGDVVIPLYQLMMRRFLADRSTIPAGNYAEVRYADLDRDPVGEVRRLYRQLGLTTFEQAEPELRRYLAAQAGYRKNKFSLTSGDRERIEREWSFAFAALRYEREGQKSVDARPGVPVIGSSAA